jgi:hypothetical protein
MTTFTTSDWRALCFQLNQLVVELAASHPNLSQAGIAKIVAVTDRADAALAQPEPEGPTDEAWQEFIEQVQHAQHVAVREGEGPRFDLVECALALWREAIPPVPEPLSPLIDTGNERLHLVAVGVRSGYSENSVAKTALTVFSDEEIDELWDQEGGYFALYEEVRRFARALIPLVCKAS